MDFLLLSLTLATIIGLGIIPFLPDICDVMMYGHWHKRYKCTECGKHSDWKMDFDDVCPGCSIENPKISSFVARRRLFWRWEEK